MRKKPLRSLRKRVKMTMNQNLKTKRKEGSRRSNLNSLKLSRRSRTISDSL